MTLCPNQPTTYPGPWRILYWPGSGPGVTIPGRYTAPHIMQRPRLSLCFTNPNLPRSGPCVGLTEGFHLHLEVGKEHVTSSQESIQRAQRTEESTGISSFAIQLGGTESPKEATCEVTETGAIWVKYGNASSTVTGSVHCQRRIMGTCVHTVYSTVRCVNFNATVPSTVSNTVSS
jgi:hypothetical protein